MYALIQHDDIKSRKLADEIDGLELYMMEGSTNKIPIHLVWQIISRKKRPKAVVLRYLNDSNSFVKSLIRLITTVITILLTLILRIKLVWICHNVDKESKEYFPLIVKLRRRLVIYFSNKILVTDKLLIEHAEEFLKVNKSKIDYITFGRPVFFNSSKPDINIMRKIIEFTKDKDQNTLIGLSIGNPNAKVLQPFYTHDLVNKSKKSNIKIKIILGGPIGDYIKQQDINVYNELINDKDILFLDQIVNINEEYISQYIDFYWRVYDDFSVPFTVYNAVYLKKPILTMNKGFLGEMVRIYNIGTVLDNNFSNIDKALSSLKKDRNQLFQLFIDSHNWGVGADKIYNTIKNL